MSKKMLFLCLLLFCLVVPGKGEASDGKKIFIVASYEEGHICGGPQEEGVVSQLARNGYIEGSNLQIERYYMDSKRKNTTAKLMQSEAAIALTRIETFKPDVVVAIDDNAFREVGLPLAGRDDVAVVFSGLNGQVEAYDAKVPFLESRLHPGSNITGVYEKLYVEQSLRVMKAIPGLTGNTFVFITDYTPTGQAVTKQLSLELAKPLPGLGYRFEKVHNWEEYKALIKQINSDASVCAIYPAALSLKANDGQTHTARKIFEWTIAHCTKPGMAVNYFFSKVGLFGGAAVDFKEMGALAGKQTALILDGAKPGDLPIEDAPEYAIVFNLKRAKKLDIEIPSSLLTAADYVYN